MRRYIVLLAVVLIVTVTAAVAVEAAVPGEPDGKIKATSVRR